MEISFALKKNGDSVPIGLGGRSFPVVRLAGRLAGWQVDEILISVLI